MMSWLPEGVSTFAPEIDRLFYGIYYLTGAVFLAVQLTLLVFVVRYRYRPDRRAEYTHGNTTLEIVWTVVPAIILVVLALVSRATWANIKERIPPSDFEMGVTAKQFNWEAHYTVPVNKTIRVVLRSKDVIHSFFVPSMRFKQDAVPGHEIPIWFKVTKPGKYEIPCAELCGFGHSGMRGWLHVLPQEEFEAWAKEHKIGSTTPAAAHG